jgi:hypothetical protein
MMVSRAPSKILKIFCLSFKTQTVILRFQDLKFKLGRVNGILDGNLFLLVFGKIFSFS